MKTYKEIKTLFRKFSREKSILKSGLSDYYKTISYFIPFMLTVMLLVIGYLVGGKDGKLFPDYIDSLISILPSLTGFLIASATILLTVNSQKLDELSFDKKYTFRQIGGAIFFQATKISFILLLISFALGKSFEINLYLCFIVDIYLVFLFSQLISYLFYGLIFLTSTMEVLDKNDK